MSFSLISSPKKLSHFQQLIRHVHDQPTQLRRALRLACKELTKDEVIALSSWASARYRL